MLADIDLAGRLVIVAGAGKQAYKRVMQLLGEDCDIIVISSSVDARFSDISSPRLSIKKERIVDASFVRNCGARIVMAATGDTKLDAIIVDAARKEPNCLAYSVNAKQGDYAHLLTHRASRNVEFAVSTHRKSPLMARVVRDRVRDPLDSLVSPEDDAHIELQEVMRAEARRTISSSEARRRFLYRVYEDEEVKRLIKDGRSDSAQERAMTILNGWHDE